MVFPGGFYTKEILRLVIPCIMVFLCCHAAKMIIVRLPLRMRKAVMAASLTVYHGIILYITVLSREQYGEVRINTDIFRIIEHSAAFGRLYLENIPKFLETGKVFYVGGMGLHTNYIAEGVYNILLFLPQGFLAGIVISICPCNKKSMIILEIGWTVLFSCLIEIVQMIDMRGTLDFGDLVHNTIGMILGLWMSLKH